MNKILFNLLSVSLLFLWGCQKREIGELEELTLPSRGEVFIDDFTSDLAFSAFGGSDVRAFSIETRETHNNSARAMRFDVPDAGSPNGSYAGGVFYSRGGRDLSGFNALTFYIKSNEAATIGLIGFGNDLGANKYAVSLPDLQATSAWKKVIVPIPDPSKLKAEKGLLYFAAAPINNRGYTFWLDDVKFEKLGTIRPVESLIMNGANSSVTTFIGVTNTVSGLLATFNLPTGVNQSVNLSPAYFQFASSNPAVATVNADGVVNSLSAGTSVISATVGGVKSKGSLTINCAGVYTPAPTPTRKPTNTISIFSDAYPNVPVNYYNGYWQPWQTTISNDFTVNGDNVLNYTVFNFVGMEFSSPTVNASSMSHLHMNFYFPGTIAPGRELRIIVVDFGANGTFSGGDDTRHSTTITAPTLVSKKWMTVELPFSAMTNLTSRSNLGQIILEGGDGGVMYVDNIYFFKNETAPTTAAPTPTRPAANVSSVFSDAYANIPNTNFNPFWNQSTQVAQVPIGGNNALRYTNFNYQGVELGSPQNVSTYTHFHIDHFTANSPVLRVYLISPGPVERSFSLPVPNTNWGSTDIPLSAFNGVDLTRVIQLKFDGGAGSEVYLDNMYFYK